MIRILADQNLYKLSEFLPIQTNLTLYDPILGLPNLDDFEALLIRSVTKIQRDNFDPIPSTLKFIGTGSSGRDHVDVEYLDEQSIHFVDAKGSNANVVAEFVVSSLIILSEKDERILSAKIGIIGVGAAGSKVNDLLLKLGHQTVIFDPPREERESGFNSADLDEVLACDVLTFHTPLEHNSNHPTFHWLDRKKLEGRNYLAIINAARGGVIDEKAVLNSKINGQIDHLVIDVWENEPDLIPEFVEACDIATPHIAGSSVQSKKNASRMLAEQLCNYFNLEKPFEQTSDKEIFRIGDMALDLPNLISNIHPLPEYDSQLRSLIKDKDKKVLFAKLRTDFPYRNEYSEIRIPNIDLEKLPLLRKLGITN